MVYFAVFGAGTFYILRLMAHRRTRRAGLPPDEPIRAAGIMPAPALAAGPVATAGG